MEETKGQGHRDGKRIVRVMRKLVVLMSLKGRSLALLRSCLLLWLPILWKRQARCVILRSEHEGCFLHVDKGKLLRCFPPVAILRLRSYLRDARYIKQVYKSNIY